MFSKITHVFKMIGWFLIEIFERITGKRKAQEEATRQRRHAIREGSDTGLSEPLPEPVPALLASARHPQNSASLSTTKPHPNAMRPTTTYLMQLIIRSAKRDLEPGEDYHPIALTVAESVLDNLIYLLEEKLDDPAFIENDLNTLIGFLESDFS